MAEQLSKQQLEVTPSQSEGRKNDQNDIHGIGCHPKKPTPRDLISPGRCYLPRQDRLLRSHPPLRNNCSKHQLVENTLHSNHNCCCLSSLHYCSVENSIFSGNFGLYNGLPQERKAWHTPNLRHHYLVLSKKEKDVFLIPQYDINFVRFFSLKKETSLQHCELPFSYQESRLTGYQHEDENTMWTSVDMTSV